LAGATYYLITNVNVIYFLIIVGDRTLTCKDFSAYFKIFSRKLDLFFIFNDFMATIMTFNLFWFLWSKVGLAYKDVTHKIVRNEK